MVAFEVNAWRGSCGYGALRHWQWPIGSQRVGVDDRRQLPGGIELGWARTSQQVGGALCDGLKKGLCVEPT